MEFTTIDILLRVSLAFILSLLFGLERQLTKKPIGFGTFTLVATGSCVLSLIAVSLSEEEPLRLLAGIITGIGFLGAGAIMRRQERVAGFTTAASIWAFAALGISIGTGFFEITAIFYLLMILVVILSHILERTDFGHYSRRVTIAVSSLKKLGWLEEYIVGDYEVTSLNYDMENNGYTLSFIFRGHEKKLKEITYNLSRLDEIKEIKIE